MALNIAVPLSGVGGLSPISPMNMECWEQIKMLVSPIGSESSGVSSLDSEEAKHQSMQSTPPDTPEEFEIRYSGRDILDLGANINPDKWHLRYTYLPENNNMPMYLANRSQYHRLGPNGHIQDYTLVTCEHCDFQYPINSGSSYFCRTSVTVSPTTTSTMTYTGPQVLKRPQQPPQQQQQHQQKPQQHQPNQQLQSLTTPLQHIYHSNNSNNSFSMFNNHNQMNSNSFLKKTTASATTTISTAATCTLSSVSSSSSAAAMSSYASSSPTSSLSSGYSSSSSSSGSGYTNMNFGAASGGGGALMKYPQQSPSNNSSSNNPFMNLGSISNNNTKSAMSSNNNNNTFNNNFCSFLNAFSNNGNNSNGYMNHTQGNNAGQQPHYGTYNYF